jgi:hypothetical protein
MYDDLSPEGWHEEEDRNVRTTPSYHQYVFQIMMFSGATWSTPSRPEAASSRPQVALR